MQANLSALVTFSMTVATHRLSSVPSVRFNEVLQVHYARVIDASAIHNLTVSGGEDNALS